jgi:cyclopropane fatty-acyl-phospholipid synthase-like methyltransferase
VTFRRPSDPAEGAFSAAVNVTSFQELDAPIVADYMRRIDEWLVPGGVFICVNRDSEVSQTRKLASFFDQYPWPENYETIVDDESIISRWSRRHIVVRKRIIRKPLA